MKEGIDMSKHSCSSQNPLRKVIIALLSLFLFMPSYLQAKSVIPAKEKNSQKSKKNKWSLKGSGYIQAGYRMTLNDPKLLRQGDSDGFYIRRARLKVKASYGDFSGIVSIEGAYDRQADPEETSPATRKLFIELRDAYFHYQNSMGLFVSLGQLKVPFGMHYDRSTTSEYFPTFPLIAVGEDMAFGHPAKAIMPGRDIGLRLGWGKKMDKIGLNIAAMVYNGNGANHFGNDSDTPAVAARFSLQVGEMLSVGGSFLFNKRRFGDPTALFDETDLAFGADVAFRISGFFVEAEFAARTTSHDTTQQEDNFSFGFRADAGYLIKSIGLEIVARFEMFDPSSIFDDDRLIYITPGVNWYCRLFPGHNLAVRLSYTIKLEQTDTRKLNNDQLNVLLQYRF